MTPALPSLSNLFADLPEVPGEAEGMTVLLETPGMRVERIVSFGHVSSPGFWYDQAEGEWIAVLRGAARLRFEDEPADRVLEPGDSLYIPAHCRHRVTWTAPDEPTVWLALFHTV